MMKPLDCSNLAVLGSVGTIVLLAGVAVLMKWVSSQVATRKQADSLTPADLRALESSAGQLIEEIKETASVAIRDLDDRCEDLRKLILIADQKISLWAELTSKAPQPVAPADLSTPSSDQHPEQMEHPELVEGCGGTDSSTRVYELADSGVSAADIARETGMPLGEVTLMLSLRSTARV